MRWLRDQRGTTAVEAGLALSLLTLLLIGMLDLGLAVFAYADISQAAREGARFGTAHPTDTVAIQQAALSWTSLNLTLNDVVVTNLTNPARIRVQVNYTYHPASPLVAAVISSSSGVTMFSRSTMHIEE